MAESEKPRRCPTCKRKGKIRIGAAAPNNLTLSDKELASLRFALGKENLKKIRTVGDVDRCLAKINENYKWTGGFGR